MTLHTKNHPHWSEGSWDNPILSPPPSLEDLVTDSAHLTEPGELPDPQRPGAVEIIGGALGSLLQGVGDVLGGVWNAGSALLSPVIDGAIGLINGIVSGVSGVINSIFGGGGGSSAPAPPTVIDELPIWSSVKADLAGAVQPHLDRIDENLALSEELNNKITDLNTENGDLRGEIEAISEDMTATNKLLEEKVGESGSVLGEIEALNQIMQDEFGPDGTVAERIDQLRGEIDERLGDTGEVSQRMEVLREDLEAVISGTKSDIQGDIDQQIASLNTSMSASISGLEEATEADYRALNTALWGDQGDINKLNAENRERQKEYQKLNNALWGEQGELNALNAEMWEDESELNRTLLDFRTLQLQFNDDQTGFNKKMQEFNQLQTVFNDDTIGWQKQTEQILANQEEINRVSVEEGKAVREMFEDLKQAQLKTEKHIAKMLPVPSAAVKNEHFVVERIEGNGDYRVTALDHWVGQMVWQGVWDGGGEASLEIHDVGIERTWDIPSWYHHPSLITYWIHEGKPDKEHHHIEDWTPDQHLYRTGFAFEAPVDATYIIYFRVGWDAATYNDWYGTRITLNNSSNADPAPSGTVIGQVSKRTKVGPLLPGSGSNHGYRTMTITLSSVDLKAGDILRFQAHSSAEWTSQRLIRDAWMEVDWIDPTATDEE